MSLGLRETHDDDLADALERMLAPRLATLLRNRGPGHCARITDVDAPLATRLTQRLRATLGQDANVYVLGEPPQVDKDVAISSTKLVELRNPQADGRQRPPLLVFVPPGTHAAAEDSFGVATFEEPQLGDVYADLAERLRSELPEDLRVAVDELFAALEDAQWPYADSLARARYLLTLKANPEEATTSAGVALFELGLVPDWELCADPDQVRTRATRNLRQVQQLTETERPLRQRVLALGLTQPAFRARLAEFAVEHGLEDPRCWTRRIALDREHWGLAFQHWPLGEEATTERVRIEVGELPLPRGGEGADPRADSRLADLAGQMYLPTGGQGLNQLPVTFQVSPDPRQIPGLARFQVRLLSEDGGPTGVVTQVKVSRTAKTTYKATLKKLRTAGLEAGWHYVQVVPQDAEGVPLPVVRTRDGRHQPHESDRFFVLPDEDIDEPPEESRVRKDAVGVTQATRRLQFEAAESGRDPAEIQCRSVVWKPLPGGRRHVLRAVFGGNGIFEIPLAPPLAAVETRILADPDRLARFRLTIHGDQADEPVPEPTAWPRSHPDALESFLAARRAMFTLLRGEDDLVVEGRDLAELHQEAVAYAEAYGELLTWQLQRAERADEVARSGLLQELNALLQLDTVAVVHAGPQGEREEAVLVAPTHPLRLLWLTGWAVVGRRWVLEVAGQGTVASETASSLFDRVVPLGFPLAVPRSDRRLTMAVDDLTPYWGVCLPTGVTDPQDLLGTLAAALGLPRRAPQGQEASGRRLAERVERYLRLHPYITTLVINVVNPGRGEQLVDMLVALQRRRELRHVRYHLRLFAAADRLSQTGEALADLLQGEDVPAAAAEFHTPTGEIVPKLAVAVLPMTEFSAAANAQEAHLTIMFDAFGGASVDAVPAGEPVIPPVHGLLQPMRTDFVEGPEIVSWHKRPEHGPAAPLPDAEEITDVLSSLPAIISAATAAVTTGQVGTHLVPRSTLELTAEDRALLHQAHRTSDWVITVDRSLGVEYFDSSRGTRRSDYIIDYEPGPADGLGHQIVISSRSVEELQALLAPALGDHGLQVPVEHVGTLLKQLRLLSGRLALKLASAAPTQRTEVLGLALARLYLEYQRALQNQILVPLDEHLELYRPARQRADSVGESVELQRTDLALFSLDARARLITCRLVEVKCYAHLGDLADYQRLKDRMAGQIESSEKVLAEHFDPHRTVPDRPDRPVLNARLAALLQFHLERSVRHQIMPEEAAREARWLLTRLDEGYRLAFTRTGLVFDLAGTDSDVEHEGGIEYHRIGADLIRELVEALPTDPAMVSEPTRPTLAELELTLPRLPEAAFQAPARTHGLPEEHGSPHEGVPKAEAPPVEEAPASADSSQEVPPKEPAAAASDDARAQAEPSEPGPEHATTVPSAQPAPPTPEPDRSVDRPIPAQRPAAPPERSSRVPAVLLGVERPSPQYGVLGEVAGRTVALDLNETHTISLFGVQGGGKSYTLGSIIEAASLRCPPVNELPNPLATIVFHYSPTLDYAPEFTSMAAANTESGQVAVLRERYGVEPAALEDIVMLVPEDQLAQRREEYPGIEVRPLKFGSTELRAEHWRFLMGAVGNQSTYIRQLQRIMKAHRRNLRLEVIRQGIEESSLSDALKQLAAQRLDLAAEYIDDEVQIKSLVRPGRLIIVDLRDEFIEKDEALGLFVVLMQLFADARDGERRFNKLVVFDEAHKYIDSPDLVSGLVESVREMRHKGMSVLVASQEPTSVPTSLIELSDHVILHKFNSPAWLKHLQKTNAALAGLTSAKMAALAPGEAYIWASKATDAAFTKGAIKVRLRPRITRHGGATKTAVA